MVYAESQTTRPSAGDASKASASLPTCYTAAAPGRLQSQGLGESPTRSASRSALAKGVPYYQEAGGPLMRCFRSKWTWAGVAALGLGGTGLTVVLTVSVPLFAA